MPALRIHAAMRRGSKPNIKTAGTCTAVSLRRVGSALRLDEGAAAQLRNCGLQFGLRVHDDRSVQRDRLLDRLAGDEQEAPPSLARLHADLVAAVEHDERTVAGRLTEQDLLAVDLFLGQAAARLRSVG